MTQQVVIIGAGALGRAIGKIIPKDHAHVEFWDIDASQCPYGTCQSLETIIPKANFIFMCVPSWAMRAAVAQYSALIKSSTIVVSLAKGLESPAGKTMLDVCTEVLPQNQPVVIMSGAMLSHELNVGLPGMALVATPDHEIAEQVTDLMRGSALQLTWSDDAHSVALAGVLKNIYAIALGICDGLELGDNTRGWLCAQAVGELLEIGKILNIDQRVLLSIAGVGDLVATGLSEQSKNHMAGVELARTGSTTIRCEGIESLLLFMTLIGSKHDFRLLNTLDGILIRNQNVRVAILDLIYKNS